jgi:hypothetical protein
MQFYLQTCCERIRSLLQGSVLYNVALTSTYVSILKIRTCCLHFALQTKLFPRQPYCISSHLDMGFHLHVFWCVYVKVPGRI